MCTLVAERDTVGIETQYLVAASTMVRKVVLLDFCGSWGPTLSMDSVSPGLEL